jgi:hypothetical protein
MSRGHNVLVDAAQAVINGYKGDVQQLKHNLLEYAISQCNDTGLIQVTKEGKISRADSYFFYRLGGYLINWRKRVKPNTASGVKAFWDIAESNYPDKENWTQVQGSLDKDQFEKAAFYILSNISGDPQMSTPVDISSLVVISDAAKNEAPYLFDICALRNANMESKPVGEEAALVVACHSIAVVLMEHKNASGRYGVGAMVASAIQAVLYYFWLPYNENVGSLLFWEKLKEFQRMAANGTLGERAEFYEFYRYYKSLRALLGTRFTRQSNPTVKKALNSFSPPSGLRRAYDDYRAEVLQNFQTLMDAAPSNLQ